MSLRRMIYEVAAKTDGVGEIEETLKWGQISYRTPVTKSGTTIRIDTVRNTSGQVGMYVNCQTTLVETFRARYGDLFQYEGSRCVMFGADEEIPAEAAMDCIAMALTYHLNKKRTKKTRETV